MGLYVYLSDWSIGEYRKLSDTDPEFRDLFLEALSYDKSLMIQEHTRTIQKKVLGIPYGIKTYEYYYTIYHECFGANGKSLYEAREMICGSGSKRVASAYLFGIINGNLHSNRLN